MIDEDDINDLIDLAGPFVENNKFINLMNFPWEAYVGDSGDEVESVEEIYPQKKLDPKDMSVKAETPEDIAKLWQSILDIGRS